MLDHEQDVIEALGEAIGADAILRSNQVATLDPGVEPLNTGASLAIRPTSVAAVSRALSVCNAYKVPVVTHGGRTGLSGAAMTAPGQVILLTDRLEGGIEIDPIDRVAVVSAAVTQQALQEAAAEHGLTIGIDTASRGSATIGGMIATNAGGMEAFRYGMMRQRVLGLQAVLADGTIVDDLTRVPKANEAYDLKQIFIGSEGTLGVVTKAVIRLEEAMPEGNTTLLAVQGASEALRVMRGVQATGGLMMSELMWEHYANLVAEQTGLTHVLSFCEAPAYLIIQSLLDEDTLLETLAPFFESGDIIDAVLAKSNREAGEIWRIREDSQAALRVMPNVLLYDISMPLSQLDSYVKDLRQRITTLDETMIFQALCHLGDGNLHVNIARSTPFTLEDKDAVSKAIEFGIKDAGGAVSAEHGIGTAKMRTLARNIPVGNLSAMHALKAAFDPNGILNPGKVLPEAVLND